MSPVEPFLGNALGMDGNSVKHIMSEKREAVTLAVGGLFPRTYTLWVVLVHAMI